MVWSSGCDIILVFTFVFLFEINLIYMYIYLDYFILFDTILYLFTTSFN